MSEVGAWEPAVELAEVHARALDEAAAGVADQALTVDEANAARLREVVNAAARRARWCCSLTGTRHASLGWLRALTLAEETVPGCEAGAKSPVIGLARLLRERGDYPVRSHAVDQGRQQQPLPALRQLAGSSAHLTARLTFRQNERASVPLGSRRPVLVATQNRRAGAKRIGKNASSSGPDLVPGQRLEAAGQRVRVEF